MHHSISHHVRPGNTAAGGIKDHDGDNPYVFLEVGNLEPGGERFTLFVDDPELLKELARIAAGLAYELAATQTPADDPTAPIAHPLPNVPYRAWYPVVDGVETVTERLACCGAGVAHRSSNGDRLHLPGCKATIHPDLASPSVDETRDELADNGAFDEAAS